jgi:hypothetical protein
VPAFAERARCRAPATAVWKLLHDPRRFPEWWAGTARIEAEGAGGVRWLEGWPDFPMPFEVRTGGAGSGVVISCLVSEVDFAFRLEPAPPGCDVAVDARVPEREAARVDALRDEVRRSLARLVARAEGAPPPDR